jgi:hypothetical protein
VLGDVCRKGSCSLRAISWEDDREVGWNRDGKAGLSPLSQSIFFSILNLGEKVAEKVWKRIRRDFKIGSKQVELQKLYLIQNKFEIKS